MQHDTCEYYKPILSFQKTHKEKLVKNLLLTLKQGEEFKLIGGSSQTKGDLVCLRRKHAPVRPKCTIPPGVTINESLLIRLNIKSFALTKTTDQSGKGESEKEKAFSLEKQIENSEDGSSDENSSKSTLDWIIPPQRNFNGKNNPFHSQYKYNSKHAMGTQNVIGALTVFEKLPEIRIVRTIKRRLNAKDIAFSHNRESKKRKIQKRSKSSDVEIISEFVQPMSMPLPTYPPVRGQMSENKDMRKSLSNMYLKSNISNLTKKTEPSHEHFQIKREETRAFGSSPNAQIYLNETVMKSPIMNSSINLYFGAINRIENGEHFAVIAKRLTFDGKEQFLLEWDSTHSVK
jgi:Polycomb-like MTF2 factor 2